MIHPTELKKKAQKLYQSFLQNIVAGIPFQPISVPCDKKPSEDFESFRNELHALRTSSKEACGYGYSITWKTVRTKSLGSQDLPDEITFQTESDLVRFVHKEKEVKQFRMDIDLLLTDFPMLRDWAQKHTKKVVEYSGQWPDVIKVLTYFRQNPHPHLYIRELPIEVHTKFIEQHKGLLRELLDILLAGDVLEDEKRFETRFHLKYDEELIRLRFLDADLSRIYGSEITDMSLTVSEFRALKWNVKTVFIVENKVNFLTFPPVPDAIIIWGHGYGIASLKDAPLLQSPHIYYWGDLDAQGFEILSQFRGYFLQVQSIFMDKSTFDRFFEHDMGTESRVEVSLNLTAEEQTVYDLLKEHNWRLEQEKIPQSYVLEHLPTIIHGVGDGARKL